jgi:hypothetical protein
MEKMPFVSIVIATKIENRLVKRFMAPSTICVTQDPFNNG